MWKQSKQSHKVKFIFLQFTSYSWLKFFSLPLVLKFLYHCAYNLKIIEQTKKFQYTIIKTNNLTCI
jgi:hypothetical protein